MGPPIPLHWRICNTRGFWGKMATQYVRTTLYGTVLSVGNYGLQSSVQEQLS